VIVALILAGWGARLLVRNHDTDDVRVIRGAVQVPVSTAESDTVSTHPDAAPSSLRIDINRAGTAEIERLPMIGQVKAAEIVRYREEHGPFAKSSDLMKVKGIGPKTYGQVKRFITVGGGSDGK
jgi:competence protein ComEA